MLAGLGLLALHGRRGSNARILRISRVVADLDRAVAFYRDGLGFRLASRGPGDPALPALLGLPGIAMEEAVLHLGDEEVALVRFDPPGAPYPPDSRSDDGWFQHLAIVVDDMAAAWRQLAAQSPSPISTKGPEPQPPRHPPRGRAGCAPPRSGTPSSARTRHGIPISLCVCRLNRQAGFARQ